MVILLENPWSFELGCRGCPDSLGFQLSSGKTILWMISVGYQAITGDDHEREIHGNPVLKPV